MVKENFLFHKVSEKEKKEIQKEAKNILEEFASKLEKIKPKTKELHFKSSQNENGFREEGDGWETDETFREIFLHNAPFVEDDSIVAEKGGWK